jgi:hypothetical protein
MIVTIKISYSNIPKMSSSPNYYTESEQFHPYQFHRRNPPRNGDNQRERATKFAEAILRLFRVLFSPCNTAVKTDKKQITNSLGLNMNLFLIE